MAGRVSHYLGAGLRRRNRCPDCDCYIVPVGLVECCPECGQILGPLMPFERTFMVGHAAERQQWALDHPPARPVVDVPTQGALF